MISPAWLLALAGLASAQQASTAAVAASTPSVAASAPAAISVSTNPYDLPTSTLTPKLDFWADEAEYNRSSGTMVLTGHVKVLDSSWTIKTDKLRVNLDDRTGQGYGFVLLESSKTAVWGDSGTFDLAAHEAELAGANGGYSPWYIQASTLTVAAGVHTYSQASFTTCSRVPEPDYYMKASVLRVKPNDYMSGTNIRFYLASIPVFYLPYFHWSLEKDKLFDTTYKFAYSERNGYEFLTSTLMRLGRYAWGRLFLDEYTYRGVGVGYELDRKAGPQGRESLYAYRIDEPGGTERWEVLGNAVQPLGTNYNFQARVDAQSDPQFNNDYYRTNFFPITPELDNSAAIVRHDSWGTERVSYSRVDVSSGTQFQRISETFPRLDYNSAAIPAPLGIVQTVGAYAERGWESSDGFDHDATSATWNASKTFRLGNGFSFVPRLTASEQFDDKVSTMSASGTSSTLYDTLFAHYGGGGLLRYASRFGNLDLDYNYLARSKLDALDIDKQAGDRGVESEHLTLTDLWRPNRQAYLRLQTGYDLRDFGSLANESGKAKFDPISANFLVQPSTHVTLSVIDDYSLTGGQQSTSFEGDYGGLKENHVGTGFFTSQASPGKYYITHTAGYGQGTWRLAGRISYPVGGDAADFKAYDEMVTIEKTFHDFYTFLLLRNRSGVREIGFHFNLLFNYERKVAENHLEAEQEWYPWRDRPDQR